MTSQLRLDFANRLFFGDNLEVLRRHVTSGSVDLVYLDPPFNSNRSYNLLFEHQDGRKAAAQVKAFDDSWGWDMESARVYGEIVTQGGDVSTAMRAMRSMLGTNDLLAYLTMMAPRLVELHRVLKQSGSLYLHCDPRASHYLKLLLDAVFGPEFFRNEIIWKRTSGHSDAKRFGRVHDVIFFYTKGPNPTWNQIYQPYEQSYVDQYYRYRDSDGRRFMSDNLSAAGLSGGGYEYTWKGVARVWRLPENSMRDLDDAGHIYYTKNGIPRRKRYFDEAKGLPAQDIWTDIEAIRSWHKEQIGFPTQKPMPLLERIIEASSNPDDVVLDPFCGCGTAVDAAQKLGRRWIGIDVTKLAVDVIEERLQREYGQVDYVLDGEPSTIDEAEALAALSPIAFQAWVGRQIGAARADKPGADRGIDGEVVGVWAGGDSWRGILSVKGGSVGVAHVRDLRGTIEREGADFGIYVSLRKPTAAMKREAADAGFTSTGIPKLQLITVEELLDGRLPDQPPPGQSKEEPASRLRAV